MLLVALRLIGPEPNPPHLVSRTSLRKPLLARRKQRLPTFPDLTKLSPKHLLGHSINILLPDIRIKILDLAAQRSSLLRRRGVEDLLRRREVAEQNRFRVHDGVFGGVETYRGVVDRVEDARVPVLQPGVPRSQFVAVEEDMAVCFAVRRRRGLVFPHFVRPMGSSCRRGRDCQVFGLCKLDKETEVAA